MHKLEAHEVASRLVTRHGWADEGGALVRTFELPDYHRVMALVNAIAFVAHAQDHHPDLSVHYAKVVVRYTTHDAGGISELDFAAVDRIERLLAG